MLSSGFSAIAKSFLIHSTDIEKRSSFYTIIELFPPGCAVASVASGV